MMGSIVVQLIKLSAGTPTSHVRVPGSMSLLHLQCSFLLCILGDSRW